jgi:hypothetical protein
VSLSINIRQYLITYFNTYKFGACVITNVQKRMYESMRQRKSNQNSTSTVEYVLLSRKGPDALDRTNVKIYNSSVGKKAALVIKIPDGKSSSMFVSDE